MRNGRARREQVQQDWQAFEWARWLEGLRRRVFYGIPAGRYELQAAAHERLLDVGEKADGLWFRLAPTLDNRVTELRWRCRGAAARVRQLRCQVEQLERELAERKAS